MPQTLVTGAGSISDKGSYSSSEMPNAEVANCRTLRLWYFRISVCGLNTNAKEPGNTLDRCNPANPPPDPPKKITRRLPCDCNTLSKIRGRTDCNCWCRLPAYQARYRSSDRYR